jgi:hypothetical protein
MLKVMLIGDSIRMNYQERLREILRDRAVIHSPEENCRFAAYTLFSLWSWVPDDDYDIIQWNNGQWDTCYMLDGKIHTPLPEYLSLQSRIATILRPRAKRLVFATTTPVHSDQFTTAAALSRKNEDIEVYNRAAAALLGSMGVEILDLYAAAARDVTRYIGDDKVHLSPDGIDLCARQVAESITGGK